jgi:alpha-beta hydrolase superfamily lysophospholipase
MSHFSNRVSDGWLAGAYGLTLYYRHWFPHDRPKATVGIVHGLGSHSGAFSALAIALTEAGYGVYGLDLRGHGRSLGQRGYIQRWVELREDLHCFQRFIQEQVPHQPSFLLGHSLGAIIVLDYALYYPETLAGAIAMAPAIGPVGVSPLKLAIGRILSWVWPQFTLDTGIPEKSGTHDPAVLAIYAEDPLRHTKGTARLASEFLQTTQRLRTQLPGLQVPLLLLQGSADVVALPEGSRQLFQQIRLMDKEYREYPGSYHDLQNDTCAQQVAVDIIHWLNQHISGQRLLCQLSHLPK